MSKSNSVVCGEIMSLLGADSAEAKRLAAEWKQKVVPAILVTCINNKFRITPTMLRRSGGSWQHDLDDALNEVYPIRHRGR